MKAVAVNEPEEKDYMCGYCDEEFERKGELLTHLDEVHPVSNEKLHVCSWCGEEFLVKEEFLGHLYAFHRG